MASRSLSGGSPRRLWLDQGKWVLEVVRHVNIGNDLVRPTTECLSGSRMISSYFKSNPDQESLARGAQKLMQTPAGSSPRSYSAVGSEWISSSLPPGSLDLHERSEPMDAGPSLENQLAELSMRVTALVALQEGLLVRLARLEARVLDGGVPESTSRRAPLELAPERAAAAGKAARVYAALAPAASEPSEPPEPRAPADAAFESEPAEQTAAEPLPSSAASMPAPARAEAAPERARPRPELELPPFAELCKCVALLVGSDVTVEATDPLAVDGQLQNCYAAVIEDDGGEQVGLILMDLLATVLLGGTLMIHTTEQLDQQLASGTPEPDSIAASAEICNALCGAINAAQSRYHVRAGSLERFEIGQHAWSTSVATRRDLLDSLGGRTTLLACPGI